MDQILLINHSLSVFIFKFLISCMSKEIKLIYFLYNENIILYVNNFIYNKN